MNALFEAAQRLQSFCDSKEWANCFIGGLAVLRWGEPRLTKDADLTLITGFGLEESFIDALLESFPARIENAHNFALQYRTLLLSDPNGTPFDIALGGLPFEERTVQRSSEWFVDPRVPLRTCSAEDLIVHKAFANRDHDWIDVQGIIDRQGPQTLNWSLIRNELNDLLPLKEDSNILEKLEALRSNPPP